MKKIIIIGDGDHALVVIDILNEMKSSGEDIEILGLTSINYEVGISFHGVKVLGNDDILLRYLNDQDIFIVLGVGGFKSNSVRKKMFIKFTELGLNYFNVIHPKSIISKSVKIGKGVVIFPNVILNANVEIGDNTIIATSTSVDHGTKINNHVLISAGVTIGGNVKIGEETLLALGSKVISNVNIGYCVLVAAGAIVVSDIEANKTVFGIPAKANENYERK